MHLTIEYIYIYIYIFFFLENRAVYEKMVKCMVEPETTDYNIIRRMRVAYCISQAKREHT